MAISSYVITALFMGLHLLYSCQEINYHESSKVNVTQYYKLDTDVVKPPFKRIVFVTADGLREDSFYLYPDRRPFLKEVMSKETSIWGTIIVKGIPSSVESHQVMFTGISQDPADIMWIQLWHTFIQKPDSLFTHMKASATIALGRVVNALMEKHPSKIFIPTKNDTTAFQQFNETLLTGKLGQDVDQILIFVHFNSLDGVANDNDWNSSKYLDTMQAVDAYYKRIEQMIGDYFRDDDTLFVFTSDHGISNFREHSLSFAEVLRVPYVLWGKKIHRPDEGLTFLDISQEDLAPTLACAVGVYIPSNVAGRFIHKIWMDHRFSFEALHVSFLQLHQLMTVMRAKLGFLKRMWFWEFPKETRILSLYKMGTDLNATGNYTHADAIKYYQNYDKFACKALVTAGNLCWLSILGLHVLGYKKFALFCCRRVGVALLLGYTFVKLSNWSLLRLPYPSLCVYMGCTLVESLSVRFTSNTIQDSSCRKMLPLLLLFNLCGALAALGVDTNFSHIFFPAALSLPVTLISIQSSAHLRDKLLFIAGSVAICITLCLPVTGWRIIPTQVNHVHRTLGGFLTFALGVLLTRQSSTNQHPQVAALFKFQLISTLIIPFLTDSTAIFTNIAAWTSLLLSYLLPIQLSSLPSTHFRLASTFLSISGPLLFTTLSYDAYYFPAIFLFLIASKSVTCHLHPEFAKLHQAYLYYSAVIIVFYGTTRPYHMNPDDFQASLTANFATFSELHFPLVLLIKFIGPLTFISASRLNDIGPKTEYRAGHQPLAFIWFGHATAMFTFLSARTEGPRTYVVEAFVNHVFFVIIPLVIALIDYLSGILIHYSSNPHRLFLILFPASLACVLGLAFFLKLAFG